MTKREEGTKLSGDDRTVDHDDQIDDVNRVFFKKTKIDRNQRKDKRERIGNDLNNNIHTCNCIGTMPPNGEIIFAFHSVNTHF